MSNLSRGKYAQFISDRSGQAFPYTEMVIEWCTCAYIRV